MAKVFSIHSLDLRPGVQEAEFERFVREKLLSLVDFPGEKLSVLKGDRGERAGKYAILVEIDSVETRDRYYPGDGLSAEAQALVAQQENWQKIADEFGTYITDSITDYVQLFVGPT